MALVHHRHVSEASALPLMLYQAGVGTRELAYSESVLAALIQLLAPTASDEDVYLVWADTRLGEFAGLLRQADYAAKR